MGARLACNQNAAIFDDFWQSRTPTYWTYFKREFDKKGVNISVLAGFVLLLSGINTSSARLAELDVYDKQTFDLFLIYFH